MIQQLTPAAALAVDLNVEHRTEGDVIFQLTPTADSTITAVPDGLPGQTYVFKIVTAGTSSYTLTFGSGFKTVGTLATGTTSAKIFTITFVSDGVVLLEKSRTTAM